MTTEADTMQAAELSMSDVLAIGYLDGVEWFRRGRKRTKYGVCGVSMMALRPNGRCRFWVCMMRTRCHKLKGSRSRAALNTEGVG